MNNVLKRLAVLSVILILWGCAKEENVSSSVPYRQVEININTTLENSFDNPYYTKIYSSAGYAGVIVISYYASGVDLSLAAFDLCCPYEAPAKNVLEKINTLQLQCPKCKSVYNIGDGSGRYESGPTTERLRKYYVNKDGTMYRIRN